MITAGNDYYRWRRNARLAEKRKRDIETSGTYQERKLARVEYYRRFVHGWCQRACTACNGSGVYDDNGRPKCSSCDGTGRETYAGPISAKPENLGRE